MQNICLFFGTSFIVLVFSFYPKSRLRKLKNNCRIIWETLFQYICLFASCFLYQMVAHFTLRPNGVNQAFRFVQGIWLHWKSRQIRKKKPILHHTCATWSELPSYISSMVCLVINLLLFLFVNCLAPIWKVCLCFSSLLFCFTVGILTWYPDKENKSGRFVFWFEISFYGLNLPISTRKRDG